MTSLSEIYGHEENLSKAIAESDSFEDLLNICGVVPTEKAIFETRVDLGHDDHEGRIDIIQPTTAGVVIVEVQYGTSDNSHARRLQNYATNFRKPAFVVWVAEKFRKDHVALFEQEKTPVLCATVSQSDDLLKLKKASPIYWTKQSQAKRIREAHKKCLELMEKLFVGKPSTHCYEKGFIPMQKFFGQTEYHSLSSARAGRYKTRNRKGGARNKAWDFEQNVQAIIEWYLQGLPKKTQFYLLKHPSFVQTKEQWKDEMACYWMLCNMYNDHPYVDMAYETDDAYRRLDHESRNGLWKHGSYDFAHQGMYRSDPYGRLFDHAEFAELVQIEQQSNYSKGTNCSILEYAWDMPKHAGIKDRLLGSLSIQLDIPMGRLIRLDYETFHILREYTESKFEEAKENNSYMTDTNHSDCIDDCKRFADNLLTSSGY